jgi:Spy/CpxP family protein refolding chaperone
MRKRAILAAALFLCVTGFVAQQAQAQAQPSTTTAQKMDKLEALTKQLNLTPEQKMKLLPILKADAPKLQAIKDDTSLTGMQKLEKIRAIREQSNPQVEKILTPQQYQQLQDIRREEIMKMMQQKRAEQ